MKKTIVLRALLTGAGGLAMSAPAFAQSAAEGATDETEIVVTAQHREQNVQDVPIAISVISGQALKDRGVSDFKDLGKIAPSVQITDDNSVIHVTVRGIGTYSNDEAQDSSVTVNVDGEYMNRGEVLNVSLFDLDRVEVLRGPQGTLYGRNSTAGAVNFITRKFGGEFGANADVSYGSYNTVKANAGVDIPLGDIGGIRLAGMYTDHDGYFKHPKSFLFPGGPSFNSAARSGQDKVYAFRGSLRLKPTDALTVDLAGEYAQRKNVNAAYGYVDLNSGGNGATGPGCNANGFTQIAPGTIELVDTDGNPGTPPVPFVRTVCIPDKTNFLASQNRKTYTQPLFGTGPGYKMESTAIRGRIAYEFGPDATLTYTGGYRTSSRTGHQGLPVVYQADTFQNDVKTQSHELRLNGKLGGAIYQVGGFYFKEKIANESAFFIQFLNPSGFNGGNPIPGFGENGTDLSYFIRNITSKSWSLFGQVEVPLTEQLTATGGIRYTDDKRGAFYINGSPFVTFDPTGTFPVGGLNPAFFGAGPARKPIAASGNPTGSSYYRQTSGENKVTWLVGLDFKPDSDTLVYAKVATGYKAGGFDSVGLYKAETNTAYEAGLKKNFGPGSRNTFNLSGFYYDYKDLQVSVLLNTLVGGQIFNAGKAKIWGVEAETQLKLTEHDTFTASFNYLHSRYGDFFGQYNVFCVEAGCGLNGLGDIDPVTPGIQQPNFKGNTTPFSPEVVVTLGLDHLFDLGGAGTVRASAYSTIKSSYFTDFFNYHDLKQDSLTQTDLSLEYKPDNKRFSIQAFVRNLENKRPLVYAAYISAGPDDILNFAYGTPRIWGVKLGVDF